MRRVVSVAAAAVIVSGAAFAGGKVAGRPRVKVVRAPAREDKIPEVVAEVNGVKIKKKQFNREMQYAWRQMLSRGVIPKKEQLAAMRKEVVNSLIDSELLYQDALKKGIKITEKQLDGEMAGIKKKFPNDKAFVDALSRAGMTLEDLKNDIRHGLAVKKLVDDYIAKDVKVSDAEVKKFYDDNPDYFKQPEQVRASHIIVRVPPKAGKKKEQDALDKIKKAQKELKEGKDFAAVAKKYSEGPSASRGGDLGYFQRGQMVKSFEDVAFKMKKDEVSDIVRTRFGFHIIKVTDRKPAGKLAFEKVKDDIKDYLQKQKTQKAVDAYVAKLRKTAKIKVNL